MVHEFYIGSIKLPVTPQAIAVDYKGKNKTLDLLNGDELNVLNKPRLTSYKFDFYLPSTELPIVKGYIKPFDVVSAIEKMMQKKKVIPFIIIRHDKGLKSSIIRKATVEDFNYKEDSKSGPGLMATITLKMYIPLKSKEYTVTQNNGTTELNEVISSSGNALKSLRARPSEPINVVMRRANVPLSKINDVLKQNKISVNDDLQERVIDLDV